MPLRKSPRRTPALLAANRRNAQKSTGPRRSAGWQRPPSPEQPFGFDSSGFLAVLSRQSLARQLDFSRLYMALYCAMYRGPHTAAWALPAAIDLWRTKCDAERKVRSPAFRRWVEAHGGLLPLPMRLLRSNEGNGGVSITIFVRPGRGAARNGVNRTIRAHGRSALHVELFIYRTDGRRWRRLRVAARPPLPRRRPAPPATSRQHQPPGPALSGADEPHAEPRGSRAETSAAANGILRRLRNFVKGKGPSPEGKAE